MLYTTDQMMAEFAEHWSHSEDSIIYGLMDEMNQALEFGSDLSEKMADWTAIDKAQGTTLDMIAEQYQVARPDGDDGFLRFLIRLKSQVAQSDGTLNAIAKIIAGSLEVDIHSIQIVSNRTADNKNVNHVAIRGIPDDIVTDEREKSILLDNLKGAAMLGVWIDEIAYRASVETSLYIGTAMGSHTTYEIGSEEVAYG